MQRDRLRILLIEDNPGDARLIREMLREAGAATFELDCAERMGDAFERLTLDLPDVILSDLSLPDSAGLATFMAVHARAPQVPIIVLTSLDDGAVARKAMRAGAQDYLVKGRFEAETLARSILYATERQRAGEALQAATGRWQETFDAMSDQVAVLDHDLRIVQANRSLREAFAGRPVLGACCYELFGCGAELPAGCAVSQVFSTGEPAGDERREHQLGGAWYDVRVSPILDQDGRVKQVLHITRDITEQKMNEAALRDSESRFRQLFEHMTSGMAVYRVNAAGDDCVIVDLNHACERISRVRRDDVVGKSVREVFPGVESLGLLDLLLQVARSGVPGHLPMSRYEDHRLTQWVENFVYRSPTGEVVAIFDDVTERQAAAEASHVSERRYRAIFQESRDPIAIVAADGILQDVNQATLDLLGYAHDEMVGVMDMDRLWAEPAHGAALQRELEAKGFLRDYDIKLRCKDGTVVDCLLSASVLRAADGSTLAYQGFVHDVTQRRRLERQFLQAQKMETVGRLAGGVAHDFNNILTAITGYAAMARNVLPAGFSARADIDEVLRSARRAADLTRQLLAFSRQQSIAPQVVNLNDLLLDVQKMLRRLIGEDVELHVGVCPAPAVVYVDPGQMEQVLVNLVVNARDAMPRGGRLGIQTSLASLDEAFVGVHPGATAGEFVLLSVEDDGVGMSEEVRARIFEPFFTTKERGQGTGLGLSTVFGIIKQHQGNIWCESELGAGTRFDVYLPVVHRQPVERREAESGVALPGGHETVLVVEDETVVRDLAVRMLRNLGYLTLEAPNGQQALKIVTQVEGKVDLLLTDVVMPRMSGKELAMEMRRRYPSLKVLFMSGYTADALTRHDVTEQEGVALLEKPFRDVTLAQRVRELLDARRG